MDELRDTPYPVRMKPELRKQLEALAEINNRPLSREIRAALEAAVSKGDAIREISNRLKHIEDSQALILSKLDQL